MCVVKYMRFERLDRALGHLRILIVLAKLLLPTNFTERFVKFKEEMFFKKENGKTRKQEV